MIEVALQQGSTTPQGVELPHGLLGDMPVASVTYRNKYFFEEGPGGTCDAIWFCMKDTADAYYWRKIWSGDRVTYPVTIEFPASAGGGGAGSGGINQVTKTGWSTKTDAAAAGNNISYNSTTNEIRITQPGNSSTNFYPTGQIRMDGGTIFDMVQAGVTYNYFGSGGLFSFMKGPMLLKATTIIDDDFTKLNWSAVLNTLGAEWLVVLGGAGTVARISPSRGGGIELTTTIVGPSSFGDPGNVLMISLQDAPWLYSRWGTTELANTKKWVGWGDTPNIQTCTNAVAPVVDTSIGGNYYLRGIRAGAIVNIDTAIAVDVNLHIIETRGNANGICYIDIDGTNRGGLTAAQAPLPTIFMQQVFGCDNIGGAVMSTLKIEAYKTVQSRYTGTGWT